MASCQLRLEETPTPRGPGSPAGEDLENLKSIAAESACPDCGGQLSKLGEDVSEMVEYVPANFFVIHQVRPKLSCTKCDHIVQAPAPGRLIERGIVGPGPLAHVPVSKYADHLGAHAFPVRYWEDF